MPFVTLTTDFGTKDFYIGRFKGHLLSLNDSIQIIDITHQIKNFDIISGAFNIKHSFESFPKGSVHIVRVDETGVIEQGLLITSYRGHLFLTPDNGLISIITENNYDWVRSVDFSLLNVFKSDEIYAHVLKSVLDGTYKEIAENTTDIVEKTKLQIYKDTDIIEGHVSYVDKFNNIITDIHITDLKAYFDRIDTFKLKYRENIVIGKLSEHFHEVDAGYALCRVNEIGYIEIAMNKGEAGKLFGIDFGQPIKIFFS